MMSSPAPQQAVRLPAILRPFQRYTSSGSFVPIIDGLRFYAISAVIIYHVYYNLNATRLYPDVSPALGWLPRAMSLGPFGVQLFFVISGFILAYPFANAQLNQGRPVRLSAYFKRRLTRLEPPYLLALVLLFLVRAYGLGVHGLLPHLAASSVYLHNAIFQEHSRVSAVTWSLEVEVQFYIMAPLLGNFFRIQNPVRRRAAILTAMIVSAIASQYTYKEGAEWLLPFLNYFLAGFLLADFYLMERKNGMVPTQKVGWDFVATALWALLGILLHLYGRQLLILPLVVFSLYYAIMHSRIWYKVTTNPWIFTIGGMCYTIYLYHNFFIRALFERTNVVEIAVHLLGPNLGIFVVIGVAYIVIIALSSALFAAVERPCMLRDWPERLRKRITGR